MLVRTLIIVIIEGWSKYDYMIPIKKMMIMIMITMIMIMIMITTMILMIIRIEGGSNYDNKRCATSSSTAPSVDRQ